MRSELNYQNFQRKLIESKNHGTRRYQHFTNNFYLMKSALRYYKEKKKMSFTSTRISEDFPIPVSVAGSSLAVLEELEIIQSRTESESKRYMPQDVDLALMETIEEVLRENYEIPEYNRES